MGVGRGEGCFGSRARAEDHVAVQITPIRRRGRVLVADEGRKPPRVVVALGRLDYVAPGSELGRLGVERRQLPDLSSLHGDPEFEAILARISDR